MSGVTYFKLLPDIEIIDDAAFARQLALSPTSPRMKVDVVVAGAPPSKNDEDQWPSGYIMVYPAFGKLEASDEPLVSKRFELSETGVTLESIELPIVSKYAIVAFIDKNENAQLDFESSQSDGQNESTADPKLWPTEPFRFSNAPGSRPVDLSLEKAAIVRSGANRTLVHFEFGKATLR
ncbi:MAG: hypothetical protein Aurels2KO_29790 [Aureliella sp.]